MTSHAQMPLVRGRSYSENLTFSALLSEQMQNEKRASDDETKTYPADCRKIAAVDSNKHDWD